MMLNPIGPNTLLQARVPASPNPFTEPNHFEEELPEENGPPGDLPEDRTETEVLPDGGGGSARMFAADRLLFQKLKKKCSSQEKTLERLSESLHLAIVVSVVCTLIDCLETLELVNPQVVNSFLVCSCVVHHQTESISSMMAAFLQVRIVHFTAQFLGACGSLYVNAGRSWRCSHGKYPCHVQILVHQLLASIYSLHRCQLQAGSLLRSTV